MVPLGSALLREQDIAVYKKMGGVAMGVSRQAEEAQRRYDKDHVMPHAYINERVLHTFLH